MGSVFMKMNVDYINEKLNFNVWKTQKIDKIYVSEIDDVNIFCFKNLQKLKIINNPYLDINICFRV